MTTAAPAAVFTTLSSTTVDGWTSSWSMISMVLTPGTATSQIFGRDDGQTTVSLFFDGIVLLRFLTCYLFITCVVQASDDGRPNAFCQPEEEESDGWLRSSHHRSNKLSFHSKHHHYLANGHNTSFYNIHTVI
mmetsp:Transcript_24185/g.57207  ORF Transcript_24185/g.57207 Transcript_24185/m.57207 type:complete len:133 (-) Transcript_24185:1816-2214(-)